MDPAAVKVAELIAREVEARVGPNATFEEQEDAAAAIAAEVAAELAKSAAREPKAGG